MSKIKNVEDWSIINDVLIRAETDALFNYETFVDCHGIGNKWALEAKEILDRTMKAREIFKKY